MEEVKDKVCTLQEQVAQLQISNSVANNINFGNAPLPSEQKVSEPVIEPMNAEENKNMLLFNIRLNIETSLHELIGKIGYEDKTFLSIMKMIHILSNAEIIDGMTCDIISQVIKIANRGVHGEIVSDEYVTFVKETYPEIMRQLKVASSKLCYIVCPRCKYSGYSKYENVCSKCNYTFDGD